jgi:hypothetical protein
VQGVFFELSSAIQFLDIQEIDKVMGHFCTFSGRWLRRSNAHVTVNLTRIGVQYFTPQPFRQSNRHACFANGCGPNYDKK